MRERLTAVCKDCGMEADARDQADKDGKEPCEKSPDGLHTWTSDLFMILRTRIVQIEGVIIEPDLQDGACVKATCKDSEAVKNVLDEIEKYGIESVHIDLLADCTLVSVLK